MAIISKLTENGKDITKFDNSTISNITIDGVDYHFAKPNEVVDGVCENAVNEPIIDMKIVGNSIQNGTPTPENPIEVESVGERTKNLLKITMELPYTQVGLTVSKNPDGSINIKGTPEYAVSLYLARNINFTLKAGTYTLNTPNINNIGVYLLPKYHWKTFTINSDTTYTGCYIDIPASLVGQYIDFNFYPQLEKGTKFTSYEPYGYKIPIKVSNENEFNYDILSSVFHEIDNKKVTVKSENTTGWAYIKTLTLKPNTQYYLFVDNSTDIDIRTPTNVRLYRGVTTKAVFTTDDTGVCGFKFFAANETYPHYVGYIYLCETNQEPITTNIYLNEPLRKIRDYADYIDYKNKKVVRKIKEYIITGQESVTAYATNTQDKWRMFVSVPNVLSGIESNVVGVLSSHYLGITATETYTRNRGMSVHKLPSFVIIYDDNYQTVDSLKAFLQEQYTNGTPVKAVYISDLKEEPIDIPQLETFDETTEFYIETKIAPSEIKIKYWKQI
jgi:hypothetical protein